MSADIASNKGRKRFAKWLVANGAEMLQPRGAYEWARFVAHGVLCIVYMDSTDRVSSFDPALAHRAYHAFKAGEPLDLSNEPAGQPVEDWHAVGVALVALGTRAKAGAVLDIPTEAAALGIAPDRLIRSLQAQGVRS